jgi:hypothetical protein
MMLDGMEQGPPPIDWQAECMKAREAAELFRNLLNETQTSLFDARVDLTMAMRELHKLKEMANAQLLGTER